MEESSEITQTSISVPEHSQTIDVNSSTAHERTFTLFPRLPPEVRRIIWSCTLSHTHIIELQTDDMIPRVTETVTIMAVCHEAREIALKLYHLVTLGPTIKASPFYFSSQASICLLRDENSPWLIVSPHFSDHKPHSWNTFRSQVTVLAVDPLLYYSPDPNLGSATGWRAVARGPAFKITTAISVLPGLKKVIVLRRAGFKKHSIEMVSRLREWIEDDYKLGRDEPWPYPASSSWKAPAIEYLDYKYKNGEDPWKATRQALLA